MISRRQWWPQWSSRWRIKSRWSVSRGISTAFWWRWLSKNRSNSELNRNRGKLGTSWRIDCWLEGNSVRCPPTTMVTSISRHWDNFSMLHRREKYLIWFLAWEMRQIFGVLQRHFLLGLWGLVCYKDIKKGPNVDFF